MDFIEIEHKYLVSDAFDRVAFAKTLLQHRPSRHERLQPTDTYYASRSNPDFVYRHRVDRDLQQLTVKSRGQDVEQRCEIDLNLDNTSGDQAAAVAAFLGTMRVDCRGILRKDLELFEFDDAEVVYYVASCNDKRVNCVEFEAIGCRSVQEGLAVIAKYEAITGFAGRERCRQSLFDLLMP